MAARFLIGSILILMLAFSYVGISSQYGNAQKQVDPGVILRVGAADVTNKVEPWQQGANAAGRAHAVVLSGAPILSNSLIGGYPPDYTGFVGYAWQLPLAPGLTRQEWNERLRAQYAVEVPRALLQAGDILANLRDGAYGDAVVFERWTDPDLWSGASVVDRERVAQQFEAGVTFTGYQLDRFATPPHAVMRTYTLRAQNGAVTIAELDNLLPGPYYALRSNRIPGYAATLDGVHIASQLTTGQSASARFVLANRGGSAITLRRISAIVYGPNALQQGVGGATMIFPEVNDIVLQPGELYEYNQVHTMTAAGSYLALPRFEVNGALSLPLEPAFFQVRAAP